MRHHWIASIPADGIGPEVIAAGLEALETVAARDGGFQLQVDSLDWLRGSHKCGTTFSQI